METVNTPVLPQRQWKEMLKISEMQKCDCIPSPQADNTDNRIKSERVQMYLSQDMKSCVFFQDSKESVIEISSIINVASYQTDPQSFSIELKTKSTLYFIAPSAMLADHWIQGLKSLIHNQEASCKGEERRNQWLREIFQALSTSNHHELKYGDVFSHVLNSKRNVVTRDFFKQKLKEYLKMKKLKYKESDGFQVLGNFVEFYKFIFDRKEIVNLYKRMTSDGAFISLSDLKYFLSEEQFQRDVTHEHCKQIIVTHEVTQIGRDNLQLSIDGFSYFMLSINEGLFNSDHDQVYQDMTQPLTHYYISSSHNTYLCGKQLSGESSIECYSAVLQKGCRCVELDCWDGDDNEPIVYHGHTLTTKILFKDIIKTINDNAFKSSPYPVIVSLENHCGLEAQKKMSSYLFDIFGDKLYTIPVDKNTTHFPSPEFFKNKILIRGKVEEEDDDSDETIVEKEKTGIESERKTKVNESEKKNELHTQDNNELRGDKEEMKSEAKKAEIECEKKTEDDEKKSVKNGAKQAMVSSPGKSEQGSSKADSLPSPCPSTTTKRKVAKELCDLINHASNVKFVSFEESDRNGKSWQSSSFVEGNMEYYVDKTPEAFIRFNRRQLSRIYPGGLRIDSSNYSPIKPWNVGCQIVALNHQTNDTGMALHYGKFRQNGQAGYVIKPSFLRDPAIKFNPNTITQPISGSKVLKMTIISGQQLPDQPNTSWSVIKDEPDPYVQIRIYGIPADEFTYTTTTFYNNSFNPFWNESFETKVLIPELAMVMLSVYDRDIGFDDFIGQAVFPFESLQPGYRHVNLNDKQGVALPCASIFVHVIIEDL